MSLFVGTSRYGIGTGRVVVVVMVVEECRYGCFSSFKVFFVYEESCRYMKLGFVKINRYA